MPYCKIFQHLSLQWPLQVNFMDVLLEYLAYFHNIWFLSWSMIYEKIHNIILTFHIKIYYIATKPLYTILWSQLSEGFISIHVYIFVENNSSKKNSFVLGKYYVSYSWFWIVFSYLMAGGFYIYVVISRLVCNHKYAFVHHVTNWKHIYQRVTTHKVCNTE